jgi:Ca2+-binding RTX toxin-like protein
MGQIQGTTGTDDLHGTDEADTLTGGAGNDTLSGNSGADTYVFNLGDGQDVIWDDGYWDQVDTVQFGPGIASTQVSVSQANDGRDIVLRIAGSTDQITITNALSDSRVRVEQVRFADGTLWSWTDLLNRSTQPTATADVFYGDERANVLTGLGGNDSLSGRDGEDTLIGGLGDDTLSGGWGADTYVFNAGDGQDVIWDDGYWDQVDTVQFGPGITSTQVSVSQANDGRDIVLRIIGTQDQLTLSRVIDDTRVRIEQVRFADNTLWSWDDLLARANRTTLQGTEGNDTLTGSAADEILLGLGGADLLQGNGGQDWLDGGAGADTLRGGAGDDIYIVDNISDSVVENSGEGIDQVQSSVSYTLPGNVEALVLTGDNTINGTGNAQANRITGNWRDNVIAGGQGADTLIGGGGNDTFVFNLGDGQDIIRTEADTRTDRLETLRFGVGITPSNLTVRLNGSTLELAVSGTTDLVTVEDFWLGGTASQALNPIQRVIFTDPAAAVTWDLATLVQKVSGGGTRPTEGPDTLTGTAQNDSINGLGGNDLISGLAGNDTLDGGSGADTLQGGAGDDLLIVDNAGDSVVENANEGTDTVQSSVTWTLGANIEKLVLAGMALNGTGNELSNTLTGNAAANLLDGGSGADTMAGGAGDDTYVVDNAGDVTTENVGEGTDTVQSSLNWTLGTNIEKLELTGTAALSGTGNELANTLTGNAAANSLTGGAGNDTLNGGAGADTMAGGTGDDTYIVDNAADSVTENTNEGTDTVQSSVTWTLGANVEKLVLTGAVATNGTGNELTNTLTGNAAANTLDGGSGADTMAGGAGDDTYIVDNAADSVTENTNEGTDTVQSAVSWTLGANVEKLVLTGTAAINGTGNELANTLTGNAAANTLDGGSGADTMAGGAGDDTYIVDNAADSVTENTNEGTDTVQSAVTWTLGANVEKLVLTGAAATNGTGNELANTLTGNAAANTLTGAAGADTLTGGQGNDTLVGGADDDTYVFALGDGQDTLRSESDTRANRLETLQFAAGIVPTGVTVKFNGTALEFTFGSSTDKITVENFWVNNTASHAANPLQRVVFTGTGEVWDLAKLVALATSNSGLIGTEGNDSLTGTANADVMRGLGGNDTLDGQGGADTMFGGTGNDLYVVDNAGDITTELAGEGTDTVQTALSWTLGDNVENLTLTGTTPTMRYGTGNAPANMLTGSDSMDILDGKAGADTMVGGKGNDIYYVDNVGDVVTEKDGEGDDRVYTAVNYTLGSTLERLYLQGDAHIGQGNAAANEMIGTDGADQLYGMDGDDYLAYAPSLLVRNASVDTLVGGKGNDRYVAQPTDVIIEKAGEGIDEVDALADYTLGNNLENLVLIALSDNYPPSPINGTGNALDNTIIGNRYANILNGGGGKDTLIGGAGNDTYIVDTANEVVTENANEGTDTVQSAISWTLGANLENLALTGTGANNATGNELANTLTGNTAANTLTGAAGADTLTGGQGNDTLVGGADDDTYVFALGDGKDTLRSESDTRANRLETLQFAAGITPAQVIVRFNGTALDLIVGATDKVTVESFWVNNTASHAANPLQRVVFAGTGEVWDLAKLVTLARSSGLVGTEGNDSLTGTTGADLITGLGGQDTIDGLGGADTMIGGTGNDTYVVDTLADVVKELPGEGIDTVLTALGNYTLGDNVENLTITGPSPGERYGTGNALNNVLTGSDAPDSFDGVSGADTMIGGKGDDTYRVNSPDDVVTEKAGEGNDRVISTIDYTLGDNVEYLSIEGSARIGKGNALDNMVFGSGAAEALYGFAGNDRLYGWTTGTLVAGAVDTLVGGAGNDTYVVNAGDVIVELAKEGTDVVMTRGDYTLSDNIEELWLFWDTASRGTGNALDNKLTGNDGANTLDGGAGKDTLIGGAGNDVYLVDNAGDVVTDDAGKGTDTVQSTVAWTLGANLENLTLTGAAALNATGNAAANVLTGNAGNNVLDGLGGADTMAGGAGDDTYVVDSTGDVVTELANAGTDTVTTTLQNYALGDNVENLKLTGTLNVIYRSATGNALANVLTGSDGADILDGQEGADTLIGGKGNDVYRIDNAGDVITEKTGEGNDTVQVGFNYTLGANLENLQLSGSATLGVGNAADNLLYGTPGADRLDGLAGNDNLFDMDGAVDTLVGGAGNDVYMIDADDIVQEKPGEGTDEIDVAASYTLGADLENLRLRQIDDRPADFSATGNALANTLWGNDGNNVLDGGVGKDKLLGGKGDDTYLIDDAGDTVTENASEGTDTVQTALTSYLLGANVEHLTFLASTAASKGTGNALANVLRGNAVINTFDGGDGNDTLIGGLGADVLTGGKGSDTFYFGGAGRDTDTIKDFTAGADKLVFLGSEYGGLSAGTGAGRFATAKGNHDATQAGAQFVYDTASGGLWFDPDGNTGTQAAWQVATLTTKPVNLTAADIAIVNTGF